MKKFATGMVIGKFYPPHLGHKFLIEAALENSEKVWVIVCDKAEYKISGKIRADWIRQIHPEAEVILINQDGLPDRDSKLWAEKTVEWLGFVPEVVFSSEEYCKNYAQLMGSKHILVDEKRTTIPISGTMVRQDPMTYLNFLAPIVREYFEKNGLPVDFG